MAFLAGRTATVVAAATAALVLAPAPARAVVTSSTDGVDTVSISSNSAGDVMAMTCFVGQAVVNGSLPLPTLNCQDVAFVEVEANGGADTVDLSGVTTADFPALGSTSIDVEDSSVDTVTGSAVRDVVVGDGADVVSTGPGDDRVEGAGSADGGAGDDTLRGVSGAVQGGPGDDLVADPGSGPIDGGSGSDTVVLDYSAFASQQAVALVLDDASINSSVTSVGIEAYDVTTADGGLADIVDSRSYSGRVTVRARGGDDTFRGGPGADVADLGAGDDVADPGPGSDFVLAGDGDDTIGVRDGFGDVVECGPGNDTVTADRSDILSGCESVLLPAPETGAVAGTKKVRKGAKTYFTFASSVAGAGFECRVDTAAYRSCSSPFKLRTRKLPVGRHVLSVRAVQPAGNADATPSTFRFKVVKRTRQA